MARTKGAKNKPKYDNNFAIINLNKQVDNSPEINDRGYTDYVKWGKNNDYPMFLLNLYENSVIHHSCIDFITAAICGERISNLKDEMPAPNINETWETFLNEIALQYALFNAFAFQIVKNKDGKTYSFYAQPIPTIRLAKKDGEGNVKSAFLCQDWTQTAIYKPVEIDMFNFAEDEEIKSSKPYLFAYFKKNLVDPYYSTPSYVSALNSIKASINMQDFDFNSTENSFTPSGIIELNQIENEEERSKVLRNIKDTFTGAKNASNLIVTFKNSNEDQPIGFTAIAADTENINKFADTSDRICNSIVCAHRVPNKSLLGMPVESQGFSDQGNILEVSYNLMERVVISQKRKTILTIINKCFALNNVDVQLEIEPLHFNLRQIDDTESASTAQETNETVDDKQAENNDELINK